MDSKPDEKSNISKVKESDGPLDPTPSALKKTRTELEHKLPDVSLNKVDETPANVLKTEGRTDVGAFSEVAKQLDPTNDYVASNPPAGLTCLNSQKESRVSS